MVDPNECIFEQWEKRYGGIKNRQLYLHRDKEIEASNISKTINIIKQNQTQLQSIGKVRNGNEGFNSYIEGSQNEAKNNEEFEYDWDKEESYTKLRKITADNTINVTEILNYKEIKFYNTNLEYT